MAGKLTRKQEAFVGEYLIDFNGQQAAERAGYKPTYAKSTASRLLKKSTIGNLIDERLEALKMDADEALRLLADKARNAKSENVQVRALESVLKVHSLTRETTVLEGDITIEVILKDED